MYRAQPFSFLAQRPLSRSVGGSGPIHHSYRPRSFFRSSQNCVTNARPSSYARNSAIHRTPAQYHGWPSPSPAGIERGAFVARLPHLRPLFHGEPPNPSPTGSVWVGSLRDGVVEKGGQAHRHTSRRSILSRISCIARSHSPFFNGGEEGQDVLGRGAGGVLPGELAVDFD